MQRFRIDISGQVQGVGFRPQVWRAADQLQLTGWVKNTPLGVSIEVQGTQVSLFFETLQQKLPKLASIEALDFLVIPTQTEDRSFRILQSEAGSSQTIISPDTAICQDCLKELFDPDSRYYHYAFLNCVQCGPRLSICHSLPYDRQSTSMKAFDLCQSCLNEYENPANRRYHAQPTACAKCGPQLSHTISDIVKKIQHGKIVALKGMGGYQLIGDARNEASLLTLRKNKHREAKPFAVMVLNAKSAANFVSLNKTAIELLEDSSRPIVILPSISSKLPASLAPGLNQLGIMLPSTPMHYLLFNAILGGIDGSKWLDDPCDIVLLVTSANISGQPLLTDDQKARDELVDVADDIVSYNRQIVTRLDDSVMQLVNQRPAFIRRARGFVPRAVKLPHAIPETLALGGQLKNTICVTRGDEAFISQHIGSLDNQATIEFYHETLDYLLRFLAVTPQRIACDLHPDFYTTRLAHTFNLPAYPVQHHLAHLQAVMAEYAITKPAVGLILDGYGYGGEGESWGGELFLIDQTQCQRIGHFQGIQQPGGELAIKQPWRMAAAVLASLNRHEQITQQFSAHTQAAELKHLLQQDIKFPMTTSCGRLFDAVSAILGVCEMSTYEGQAAMQLESLVSQTEVLSDGWQVSGNIFSITPLLDYLAINRDSVKGANLFHGTLIAGLTDWLCGIVRERQVDTVLFSGGCFLNKVLSQGLMSSLSANDLKCYLPRQLPINDGGLSFGQAWAAGRQ